MLVLKILLDFRKVQLFPAQNYGARQLPHPRKPPMPHNDGSATDRASAWRARKTGADCTQRAVSPPGRTAACACDCIELGLFFSSSFLQRPNSGCLDGFARVRGLHCSGTHLSAERWSTSTK